MPRRAAQVEASLPALDAALVAAERLEARSSALDALCAAARAVRALRAAVVPLWDDAALAHAIVAARATEGAFDTSSAIPPPPLNTRVLAGERVVRSTFRLASQRDSLRDDQRPARTKL